MSTGGRKKRNDLETGMTKSKNIIFPNMLIYSDKLTHQGTTGAQRAL